MVAWNYPKGLGAGEREQNVCKESVDEMQVKIVIRGSVIAGWMSLSAAHKPSLHTWKLGKYRLRVF